MASSLIVSLDMKTVNSAIIKIDGISVTLITNISLYSSIHVRIARRDKKNVSYQQIKKNLYSAFDQ